MTYYGGMLFKPAAKMKVNSSRLNLEVFLMECSVVAMLLPNLLKLV